MEQSSAFDVLFAVRKLVLWTVSLLPAMWWFSSAPLTSAQSWKTGQSTFDGQGYINTAPSAVNEIGMSLPESVSPANVSPSVTSPSGTAGTARTNPYAAMPSGTAPYPSQSYTVQPGLDDSYPGAASYPAAATYTVPIDPGQSQPVVQGIQNTMSKAADVVNSTIARADFDQNIDSWGTGSLETAPFAAGTTGTSPLGTQPVQPIASYDLNPEESIDLTQYHDAINNNIKTGVIGAPPLSQQTSSWYLDTWRWMTTGWTNHIELGIDGSQGNSETFAFQTGAEIRRKTDAYTLAFDVDYRSVTSRDVVTEDNGRFNIDFDRLLADSPWSLFTKFGLEWDEFKAFDLRLNINGGIGYHWIRSDLTTFVTRFGAGASREIGAPDDAWVPEAVFGFEGEHQVNKYNKVRAKVDYFPDWTDFDNFRLVSDFSWEILIGGSENLSLKLGLNDRYDSTPQGGAEANDFFYSLLLLVKI